MTYCVDPSKYTGNQEPSGQTPNPASEPSYFLPLTHFSPLTSHLLLLTSYFLLLTSPFSLLPSHLAHAFSSTGTSPSRYVYPSSPATKSAMKPLASCRVRSLA